MSEHTPGPWTVSHAKQEDGGCSIVSATGTVAWHVSEDDARLIAAAPELLDALAGVLQWMPPPCDAEIELQDAVNAARAAIAKATGK